MEGGNYGTSDGEWASNPGNKKLQQTQAQVNEVVGIMRNNVAKVLERDEKLSELDQRADTLQMGASQFEQQAGRLKRKYWWQNLKMMIIIGIIVAAILIIIIGKFWQIWSKFSGIIVSITTSTSSDSSSDKTAP